VIQIAKIRQKQGGRQKKMKNFRKKAWRIEKSCIFAAANEGH